MTTENETLPAPPDDDTKVVMEFIYTYVGKKYLAQILENPVDGLGIRLRKSSHGEWVPSESRLRSALLAAYIVDRAKNETKE